MSARGRVCAIDDIWVTDVVVTCHRYPVYGTSRWWMESTEWSDYFTICCNALHPINCPEGRENFYRVAPRGSNRFR